MNGTAQEFSTKAEELVDKYARLVYQLAYARTRSKEAAEDIFQDVFLKLVSKRPVFDSEEHEKAWFCRVTVNCANSYWRNPFRRRTQPLDETEAGKLSAPGPKLVADTKAKMRAVLAGDQKPRRHLTRRGLTALAAAAVLTVTALAAAPTIWQAIQNHLGNQAPYATEVNATCEDQGIRLEAVTALADNRIVRVYFTVQDLEGDRLSEDTQLDYSLEKTALSEWDLSSAVVEQLSYDPNTKTALFVINITGNEPLPQASTLYLDIMRVLSGGRYAATELARDPSSSSYVLDGVLGESGAAYLWNDGDAKFGTSYDRTLIWPTSEILPSVQTDDGATVLLPQPERETEIDPEEPFPIVAAGIAADGRLHVRVRNQAGAVWSDLSIRARFPRGEDPAPGEQYTSVAVGNDIDFCLEECSAEDLTVLEDIQVFGDYSVLSAPVDGSWSLAFPIQSVAAQSIPVSLTLPARPEGMTVEGKALELSPLSLTLLCDKESICYDTFQASGNVKSIRFEQFAPSVTLRDGTQQTASLATSGTWWATWIFDQPIDPDEVVSVTLNGETIPLS